MEMGFEVTTKIIADDKILLEVHSTLNGMRNDVTRRVIDTQEQQVRDALIALGWTPPNKEIAKKDKDNA